MEAHDLTLSTNKLSTYEDCRDRRVTAQPRQGLLDFPASRDLIELVDGRVHTEVVKEGLDSVAHAALALAKDHHWLFGHHFVQSLH